MIHIYFLEKRGEPDQTQELYDFYVILKNNIYIDQNCGMSYIIKKMLIRDSKKLTLINETYIIISIFFNSNEITYLIFLFYRFFFK